MWWAVDLLASEYGWSKNDILYGVYLDELTELIPKIERRKNAAYKMQLAIVQNPHVKNQKELWSILNTQEKQIERKEKPKEEEPKFDAVGFEMLKSKMRQNPRILVK